MFPGESFSERGVEIFVAGIEQPEHRGSSIEDARIATGDECSVCFSFAGSGLRLAWSRVGPTINTVFIRSLHRQALIDVVVLPSRWGEGSSVFFVCGTLCFRYLSSAKSEPRPVKHSH